MNFWILKLDEDGNKMWDRTNEGDGMEAVLMQAEFMKRKPQEFSSRGFF
jgi:hypothetical protein